MLKALEVALVLPSKPLTFTDNVVAVCAGAVKVWSWLATATIRESEVWSLLSRTLLSDACIKSTSIPLLKPWCATVAVIVEPSLRLLGLFIVITFV